MLSLKKYLILCLISCIAFSSFSQRERRTLGPEITFDGDTIFSIAEQPPTFIGGEEAFSNYIKKNLKYPQKFSEQGTVFISFIITTNGSVKGVKVVKSFSPEFDEPAHKVISNSPPWKPGYINGRPVNTRITIPIDFNGAKKKSQTIEKTISLGLGEDWNQGTVKLSDGSLHYGYLKYAGYGSLSFKEDDNFFNYTEKDVERFDFFDPKVNKQRSFARLLRHTDYRDTIDDFFEIIREFKTFAVLARIKVHAERKSAGGGPHTPSNKTVLVTWLTEAIDIIDSEGHIGTYLESPPLEKNVVNYDFVNENLLKQCTGDLYLNLVEYAKHNKLFFYRKEDLLKILDFLDELQ